MAESSKAPTKRQLKKIVKAQESLLKKEPDNFAARVKLAGALKDLGRIEEALIHYHQVAEAYRAAGRRVQALAVCRSVLEFAPSDQVSLDMVAELDVPPPPADFAHQDVPDAEAGGAASSLAGDVAFGEADQDTADVVVVDDPDEIDMDRRHRGRQLMERGRRTREPSKSPVSIVTDFGPSASAPGRAGAGQVRRGVSRGSGQAIGRIPIVKRPVLRPSRKSQETVRDIEPPAPEPIEGEVTPVRREEATPSRPVPESVIRRTLPPSKIEDAARDAVEQMEGFEEDVPTVDRSLGKDEAAPGDVTADGGNAAPAEERVAGLQAGTGHDAGTVQPAGGQGKDFHRGDAPLDEDSVVVEEDHEGSEGGFEAPVSASPGPSAGRRPPPMPRDEPLVPDSFGVDADELMADVGTPPAAIPGGDAPLIQEPGSGFLGGGRPRRHTSPSLLDIREVLHARSEAEIAVLNPDEEAVFAEMAREREQRRKPGRKQPERGGQGGREKKAEKKQETVGLHADSEKKEGAVRIEHVALFRDLPDEAIEELRARVSIRDLSAGEFIVREGDPGNALFILLSGRAVVEKGEGGRAAKLAELEPGAFFGEFALLSDRKRHASVRAMEDVKVAEISRRVIGRLAKSHKDVAKVLRRFYRRRLLDTLMAATPFFKGLDAKERAALVPKLRFKRLSPGDKIIREGTETGGFYLVLVGKVAVTTETTDGTQKLAELGEGEYFGEMSLLKGRPAMATVSAVIPTELVEVDAKDFYRIVGDHPEIWKDVDNVARRRELANHAILAGRGEGGDPAIV